ncbi:MAG: hypothetical protein ACYDC2_05015 [Solirubrobacteraceae bacterium]
MRRIRLGELLALLGAALVIVSLTRPWYETPSGNRGFWATFGPAAALVLLAAAGALALVAAALAERDSVALSVASAVWCVLLGFAGVIASVVRLLERPDHAGSLCIGPWLGFAGTLLILAGAWEVLRDERPSRYEPARPEPRPRP